MTRDLLPVVDPGVLKNMVEMLRRLSLFGGSGHGFGYS